MRLSDLFIEAPIRPKSVYRNYGVQTAIDSDTLNMLAMKRQYEKDVEKIKSQNEPEKAPRAKRDVVNVYDIVLPVEYVERWKETRDEKWALEKAKKWRTSSLPKEVVDSLSKDPLWQRLAIGVWDLGIKYLEARKVPKPKSFGDVVSPLIHVGVDPSLPRLIGRKIESLVTKHANKFGLDKTGRQLPGLSNTLAKEEQLDEKKKKPKPTSPEKWARAKAKARSKFEVYPSAYANAWAAKEYKRMGGGWRMGE